MVEADVNVFAYAYKWTLIKKNVCFRKKPLHNMALTTA